MAYTAVSKNSVWWSVTCDTSRNLYLVFEFQRCLSKYQSLKAAKAILRTLKWGGERRSMDSSPLLDYSWVTGLEWQSIGMAVHFFWVCEGLWRKITWQCPIQASESCSSIVFVPPPRGQCHCIDQVSKKSWMAINVIPEWTEKFCGPNWTFQICRDSLCCLCSLDTRGPDSQWKYLRKTQDAIQRICI